jgi:tRNA threonylcarbamoyladenosine biosynthesis protein TsaB
VTSRTSLGGVLLAIDTATPAVTVAVADGERVLAERTTVDTRRHGELLAPAIEAVLREAGIGRRQVEQVAVGVGPGPFTGLRVGLVTARTFGAALDLQVLGVCTLDVIALMAVEGGLSGDFRVVTDALRREVHWASYVTDGGPRRVDGPHVDRPSSVAWDGPAVGAGAAAYRDDFPGAAEPSLPSAAAMCRWVARGLPVLQPDPLYLRRPDVAEPTVRKRVT